MMVSGVSGDISVEKEPGCRLKGGEWLLLGGRSASLGGTGFLGGGWRDAPAGDRSCFGVGRGASHCYRSPLQSWKSKLQLPPAALASAIYAFICQVKPVPQPGPTKVVGEDQHLSSSFLDGCGRVLSSALPPGVSIGAFLSYHIFWSQTVVPEPSRCGRAAMPLEGEKTWAAMTWETFRPVGRGQELVGGGCGPPCLLSLVGSKCPSGSNCYPPLTALPRPRFLH